MFSVQPAESLLHGHGVVLAPRTKVPGPPKRHSNATRNRARNVW